MQEKTENTTFKIFPVGYVKNDEKTFGIQIEEAFSEGLQYLDAFSHIIVIWWADGQDSPDQRRIMTTDLPYAPGTRSGVFACRSEFRPNPVGITVCQCLKVDRQEGVIAVSYLDAFDQTPVIDIKPYFPVCDRVKFPIVAPWARDWPDCVEDAWKMAQIFSNCEE